MGYLSLFDIHLERPPIFLLQQFHIQDEQEAFGIICKSQRERGSKFDVLHRDVCFYA